MDWSSSSMIVYSAVLSVLMSLTEVFFISLIMFFFLFLEFPFDFSCVLVCLGGHNKIPQMEWLKQQKCIFSQIWRLDVQGQGAVGTGVWWGLFSWLVDGCFITVSSLGLSSVCTYEERETERERVRVLVSLHLLIRTLALWDLASPLWPHLTLITSLKDLSPNEVTLCLGLQGMSLTRMHNSVHNTISAEISHLID